MYPALLRLGRAICYYTLWRLLRLAVGLIADFEEDKAAGIRGKLLKKAGNAGKACFIACQNVRLRVGNAVCGWLFGWSAKSTTNRPAPVSMPRIV